MYKLIRDKIVLKDSDLATDISKLFHVTIVDGKSEYL